ARSMPILVTCECGRTLRARDAQAGKQCRCPACGLILIVPLPAIDDDSAAPAVTRAPDATPSIVLGYADHETVGRADPLVHGGVRPIPVIAAPPVDVARLERSWRGNLWWL